ncbi:ECF-type sigma factor [Roseateles saccharophilus]|uniref:RNA polymerase sigma factor (TIGR02999 family) n=1 Tax=Roseateles saccharophilus TaxID=304 RepID=A0A4R3UIP6_ROSSA|nr:ECF-type sigma factor [Roseateles saccharophilus]TCU88931.1 RNA polymerase sigma factor (TIGR02999 family) [Roseateles saccharophilus]
MNTTTSAPTESATPLLPLDPALRDELYRELRQMAHQRLRRSGPLTLLDTTALVHEGWLKLANGSGWQGLEPGHFMAYAATVMRSIVVDYARARQTRQRGGGATHVPLEELPTLAHRDDEYLQVHEALNDLERQDPRLARLVELRFFVGLEEAECAEALGQSRRTVQRDWQKARALLWDALND